MASEESGSLVEVKDVEVKEDKGDTSFFLVAKWNGAKFDLRLPGSSTVGQVSKKSDLWQFALLSLMMRIILGLMIIRPDDLCLSLALHQFRRC